MTHFKYTFAFMGFEFKEDNHTYIYIGRSIYSGKFIYQTEI